jgi:CRP-like cAMP-binding protein
MRVLLPSVGAGVSRFIVRNRLLAQLSEHARAALGDLVPVRVELGETVELANEPIEFAYFPDDCLMSMVLDSGPEGRIEVGMVGYEGMTAIPEIEDDSQSPFDTFVQGAGLAHRVPTAILREALATNDEVRRALVRFARVYTVQIASTSFANAKGKLEARLARWLLMVSDRLGPTFKVTHEFLGIMLGVRRSGVTLAMQMLEGKGLIRATRGAVAIVDRDGLIQHANGTYGLPEREYERLLGRR